MENNKPSKAYIVITIVIVAALAWFFWYSKQHPPVDTVQQPDTTTPTGDTWQSVEVKKETIAEENQYYSISVAYPVTNDERINAQFKTFAQDQIATFKDDTSWAMDPSIDSASEGSLSLDVDYREDRSTNADTYIFSIVTYTGGAHGLQVTRTFAFDQNGKAIGIKDLFTNGEAGLKTIATFVQKEITKKNISDAEWIKDGAAGTTENYQNFVISDTGVTFIFDAYQVAPYAAGTQSILVPTSVFKGIANPAIFK